MHLISASASAGETRQIIRDWVALLAQERYAEALEMLSPEIPPGSGSVSPKEANQWTPKLLEAVIANHGMAEPWENQRHLLKVVPVSDDLREMFENYLDVDLENKYGMENSQGWVHVDLPLLYEHGPAVSDLTARLYLKPVNERENALVLLDIHVM